MPKSTFVEELRAGEPVQTVFLARTVEKKMSRDGEPFLHLVLVDRTGEVVGRAWNDTEMLASRIAADDFIALRGETKTFGKELYIEIADLDRVPDSDVERADFFAVSRWSGDLLMEQIGELIDASIESVGVRRFLHAALIDEIVAARFAEAPAAMRNHHAYLGGLAEHVLSMARLAVRICDHYASYYPGLVDRDLVIAGCVLHDLAKVWELDWRRATDYSDQGRLVGHIPMGIQFVRRVADSLQPPLPEETVFRLEHLVASHHGELEYGSPVVPQTPEAHLLHQIDMIDSRMNMCWNEAKEAFGNGERWSGYSRALGGRLFVGSSKLRTDGPDADGPGLPAPGRDENADHENLDLFEG